MNSASKSDFPAWLNVQVEDTTALNPDETVDFMRTLTVQTIEDALGNSSDTSDTQMAPYVARLWNNIVFHLHKRELSPTSLSELSTLTRDLQEGVLHYGRVDANVLNDVVVAQGMELLDERAANVFDRLYMPAARRSAERYMGQRGVDIIDNLAGDLVMPRKMRPAKIATYRGATPLKSWLRSVAINKCISTVRIEDHDGRLHGDIAGESAIDSAESNECEEKLAPALNAAVQEVDVEERVLLKLLILDGVQQKQLAATLNIDPGTLTRRKQRAASNLLANVHAIGSGDGSSAAVHDCLELLLGGSSTALRQRVATILASAVRADDQQSEESS